MELVTDMGALLERVFAIKAAGSTTVGELRAGLTTFLTMAYILFVNPHILGAAITRPDVDYLPQLMAATALAAAFGTLCMGLMARAPYALAPGMGLNAYFTYSVVLGQGVPWRTALGAVFISGCLFLVISAFGIRRTLLDAIPRSLKYASTAGIGCFLAFIGLKNGGLVVAHPETFVTMGSVTEPGAMLTLLGMFLTAGLIALRVQGAILIGILTTTVVAMLSGAPVFGGQAFAGFAGSPIQAPVLPGELFAAFDLVGALQLGLVGIVFTFLFVDFFDTAGTLIALSEKAGRLDEHGQIMQAGPAFCADALATMFGALMGTSSTTSYIESAAGIQEGGRTGLVSVVVALLFLLSLCAWPLVGIVPAAATAPALVLVGAAMMFACGRIAWEDTRESLPALLTVLGMPLTFSITNGLALGLVSHCLIQIGTGRARSVHPVLYLLTLLLLARFIFMAGG